MPPDLSSVRAFAVHAHRDQRYGRQPYLFHLAMTVEVLERFGVADPEILAAGWLHDTIEDTTTTAEAITLLAGPRVAALVDAVTDGPGEDRAARKARPYGLIPQTPGAVLVKLADRIANVEAAIHQTSGKTHLLDVYRAEHPSFRSHLHRPGEADAMWAYLDHLLAPVASAT